MVVMNRALEFVVSAYEWSEPSLAQTVAEVPVPWEAHVVVPAAYGALPLGPHCAAQRVGSNASDVSFIASATAVIAVRRNEPAVVVPAGLLIHNAYLHLPCSLVG